MQFPNYSISQLEKIPEKKKIFENELSQEETLLKDFLSLSTTSEQILNIVPGTDAFLRKATKNMKAANGIVSLNSKTLQLKIKSISTKILQA